VLPEVDFNTLEFEKERKYISDLRCQLTKELGVEKLKAGVEFLSSTMLMDEATDDDSLLNILEGVIGADNLQYLEDLYQIVAFEQQL
jgi:hypothetical protein